MRKSSLTKEERDRVNKAKVSDLDNICVDELGVLELILFKKRLIHLEEDRLNTIGFLEGTYLPRIARMSLVRRFSIGLMVTASFFAIAHLWLSNFFVVVSYIVLFGFFILSALISLVKKAAILMPGVMPGDVKLALKDMYEGELTLIRNKHTRVNNTLLDKYKMEVEFNENKPASVRLPD